MIVSLLITILGALTWWFGAGKIETASFVFFAVSVFYLVGSIQSYKPNWFTTNSGG